MKYAWKCPNCDAPWGRHGKGECECGAVSTELCDGLVCECKQYQRKQGHGTTLPDPCTDANCYHCGWSGRMPQLPKGLQAWERKALDAGWTPPKKRAVELKKRGAK